MCRVQFVRMFSFNQQCCAVTKRPEPAGYGPLSVIGKLYFKWRNSFVRIHGERCNHWHRCRLSDTLCSRIDDRHHEPAPGEDVGDVPFGINERTVWYGMGAVNTGVIHGEDLRTVEIKNTVNSIVGKEDDRADRELVCAGQVDRAELLVQDNRFHRIVEPEGREGIFPGDRYGYRRGIGGCFRNESEDRCQNHYYQKAVGKREMYRIHISASTFFS